MSLPLLSFSEFRFHGGCVSILHDLWFRKLWRFRVRITGGSDMNWFSLYFNFICMYACTIAHLLFVYVFLVGEFAGYKGFKKNMQS